LGEIGIGSMMNLELLGIFLGGMALNATPCVYPLIPVTVAYFAARGLEDERSNAARAAHAALYVAGLAVMNSFLGVLAALTGGLVGSALQSPVLLVFVAGTLLFLAAGLFGVWELRVPTPLSRLSTRTFTGYFGSFFMGLTLGLVAAPCIGPFVLGLLTWVAASGDPRLGFLVFFTLSLGLGLPQFFLAVFSGQIHRLPRSGYWMVWIRKLLGWTLVGMAAYFLLPLLGDTVGWMLMAATVLFGGLHLALVGKDEVVGRRFRLVRSLAGAGGGHLRCPFHREGSGELRHDQGRPHPQGGSGSSGAGGALRGEGSPHGGVPGPERGGTPGAEGRGIHGPRGLSCTNGPGPVG